MELPTLADLEHSIGGRPRSEASMVRMSFYLSPTEAQLLKALAQDQFRPVSQMVRLIVQERLDSHSQTR